MNGKQQGILWGILVGAAAGSAAALLLAPKSGKELRQNLSETSRTVTEAGQVWAEKIGASGSEILDIVKDTAAFAVQEVQEWRSGQPTEEEKVVLSSLVEVFEELQQRANEERLQSIEEEQDTFEEQKDTTI
ncbi:YtxH domain-containing protein [Paenibacillus massiliensis]|uniref:YtxH domain-containing protein n=1 Tax=Paenibacillus massiliensis TaxID=225917 RepID=UPI00040DA048|nr:YtxH domain-containing protein [Paenibacillus massiliensis]